MLIIPAIDIKDGKVVRLFKGQYDQEKIYSTDPASVAKYWQEEGAKFIHVVDLDGAFCGEPKNLDALESIIKVVKIPVQFGGGLRSESIVKKVLDMGASRVILGTAAFQDRILLKKLIKTYRKKIIVSIDVTKEYRIATKGWTENAGRASLPGSFAKLLSREMGVKEIIYTDIERDGTLKGPRWSNLLNYLNLLKKFKTGIKVTFAGGISSLNDIEKLKKLEKDGLAGIIVGKALYEKKFTLKEAIKAA